MTEPNPFRPRLGERLALAFWKWGIYVVGVIFVLALVAAGVWIDIEYTKWKVRQ